MRKSRGTVQSMQRKATNDIISATSSVWVWRGGEGKGTWHFLSLTGEAGDAITAHEVMRRLEMGSGRGFGSVKVRARIGSSEWHTSVFPSKERKAWILPLKAAIRKAQDIAEGDDVTVELELV